MSVAARRYPGPTWELPVAGFIHLAGFAIVVIMQMIRPEQQTFKEPEAITVEMIGSSAKKGPVIQSAMRTPDPVRGSDAAPAPETPPNPNLKAIGKARVLGNGEISGDPKIKTSSGNASIDDACLRAFIATATLPPTPAKYASGFGAELTCKCPT